mmetsp:Transcript_21001/g.29648  ORF Transcript_21001/g.29648 Transcript_21001/m.29648 type:complete len:241 (-) Transcript_21001:686-1408(-)
MPLETLLVENLVIPSAPPLFWPLVFSVLVSVFSSSMSPFGLTLLDSPWPLETSSFLPFTSSSVSSSLPVDLSELLSWVTGLLTLLVSKTVVSSSVFGLVINTWVISLLLFVRPLSLELVFLTGGLSSSLLSPTLDGDSSPCALLPTPMIWVSSPPKFVNVKPSSKPSVHYLPKEKLSMTVDPLPLPMPMLFAFLWLPNMLLHLDSSSLSTTSFSSGFPTSLERTSTLSLPTLLPPFTLLV